MRLLRLFFLSLIIFPVGLLADQSTSWIGKEVFVFRENSRGIWTVWDRLNGRHLFYAKSLLLDDIRFEVDQEIREGILIQGRRRPHAGVYGKLQAVEPEPPSKSWHEVRYNPFEMNWFQLVSSARPIRSAKKAYFHENGRQVFVFHPQYFKKEFKLINSSGEIYLSPLPGAFGGHRGLKIYGRLDCRSALSWIRRGYYTEHRVFAATRIEFLKAGYRACKKCKP